MIKAITEFFKKIKDAFSYAFSKREQLEVTAEEIRQLIEELNNVVKTYDEMMKDNQITLPEALIMLDKTKTLISQLERTRNTFNMIFK